MEDVHHDGRRLPVVPNDHSTFYVVRRFTSNDNYRVTQRPYDTDEKTVDIRDDPDTDDDSFDETNSDYRLPDFPPDFVNDIPYSYDTSLNGDVITSTGPGSSVPTPSIIGNANAYTGNGSSVRTPSVIENTAYTPPPWGDSYAPVIPPEKEVPPIMQIPDVVVMETKPPVETTVVSQDKMAEQAKMEKPNDYMELSAIACLCNFVLGMIALRFSVQSRRLYEKGSVQSARRHGYSALVCALGALASVALMVIFLVYFFAPRP